MTELGHNRPRENGAQDCGGGQQEMAAPAERLLWSLPALHLNCSGRLIRSGQDHAHGRACRQKNQYVELAIPLHDETRLA